MRKLAKALVLLVLVGSTLGAGAGTAHADPLLPVVPPISLGPGVCC
ncbi:MAG: hypothetical protein JWM40_2868 [Frankiales bacterium]|nr:hypothetical protein [Frankiales bacterium]